MSQWLQQYQLNLRSPFTTSEEGERVRDLSLAVWVLFYIMASSASYLWNSVVLKCVLKFNPVGRTLSDRG